MNTFASLLQEANQLQQVKSVGPADLITLSNSLAGLMRTAMRQGPLGVGDLARELRLPPEEANQIGQVLVAKGFLIAEHQPADGSVIFRANLGRTRSRTVSPDLI